MGGCWTWWASHERLRSVGVDQFDDLHQELDASQNGCYRSGPHRYPFGVEFPLLLPLLPRGTLLVSRRVHHLSSGPLVAAGGLPLSGEVPSTHPLVMQPARRHSDFIASATTCRYVKSRQLEWTAATSAVKP